ncbi:hypothetical protein Goarm_021648 [Gossypium armourianum]|uniref:RNase H type-1 domain-containing protein n=1 Tax=Gossypium armourianum TaxID=34283 RepID=A0A7J9IV13_9ROSI|nr:hypothetical protein [Gossypium armourianum]
MFSIWRPSENQYIQLNFDVAYNPQQFRLASGLIARNNKGEVLVSQAILEKDIASLFAAKACAWSQAMRLGIQMGVGKIEIEASNKFPKHSVQIYLKSLKRGEEVYLVGSMPPYAEESVGSASLNSGTGTDNIKCFLEMRSGC